MIFRVGFSIIILRDYIKVILDGIIVFLVAILVALFLNKFVDCNFRAMKSGYTLAAVILTLYTLSFMVLVNPLNYIRVIFVCLFVCLFNIQIIE